VLEVSVKCSPPGLSCVLSDLLPFLDRPEQELAGSVSHAPEAADEPFMSDIAHPDGAVWPDFIPPLIPTTAWNPAIATLRLK